MPATGSKTCWPGYGTIGWRSIPSCFRCYLRWPTVLRRRRCACGSSGTSPTRRSARCCHGSRPPWEFLHSGPSSRRRALLTQAFRLPVGMQARCRRHNRRLPKRPAHRRRSARLRPRSTPRAAVSCDQVTARPSRRCNPPGLRVSRRPPWPSSLVRRSRASCASQPKSWMHSLRTAVSCSWRGVEWSLGRTSWRRSASSWGAGRRNGAVATGR